MHKCVHGLGIPWLMQLVHPLHPCQFCTMTVSVGVKVSNPVLFKPTTFKDANPEEPKGNKLSWTAGITLAVCHDIIPILTPLLETGTLDFESDPLWLALCAHCR